MAERDAGRTTTNPPSKRGNKWKFIELFDNWAFDEVIRQSKLDTKRVLVQT